MSDGAEADLRYGGLLAVVAAGQLRPAIERSFALEEVPAALDHLAGGAQRGKLTIRIG